MIKKKGLIQLQSRPAHLEMGCTRFSWAWFSQVDLGLDQVHSRQVGLDLRADGDFGFWIRGRWGFRLDLRLGKGIGATLRLLWTRSRVYGMDGDRPKKSEV